MATAAPDDTENKQWFPFDRAGVLPGTTVSETSLNPPVDVSWNQTKQHPHIQTIKQTNLFLWDIYMALVYLRKGSRMSVMSA
jgi:hypothetical protein